MKLKIFLATMGSRGDFEPFLNFAIGAKSAGHTPILAVTSEFVESVKQAGIEAVDLQGSIQEFVQDSGVSVFNALKDFNTRIRPMMTRALEIAAQAIVEAKPDYVLHHPKILSAPMAAAKVKAVSVQVELAPLTTPTKEFGAAGVGNGNLGPLNKLTYKLIAQSSSIFTKELKTIADSLGVSVRQADHNLCLVSPKLLERPKDWPETTHLVSTWSGSKVEEKEDPKVLEFITKAPTAYFGFGSMAEGDATKRTKLVRAAARSAGFQALIVTGWGGLVDLGDEPGVMTVESVNHSAVLPLVKVAVHHGGAGTVNSALKAGTPSVIVPFIADQPWWGALLERKKLGPKPIPAKAMTVKKLHSALVEAQKFEPAVSRLAQQMSQEAGIEDTLKLLPLLKPQS